MKSFLIFTVFFVLAIDNSISENIDAVYGYNCRDSVCTKVEINEQNKKNAISLPVCRMFCGDTIGTIWPKPTGTVEFEPLMQHISVDDIKLNLPKFANQIALWIESRVRFLKLIKAKYPEDDLKAGGKVLDISFEITDNEGTELAEKPPKLTLDTDETYKLKIAPTGDVVSAVISAKSYFGARHGLETLSQLIVYDDIRREVQILTKAEINDGPVYKWRGLLLDTSRNFYSTKAIKRTLDAMAMVKLNTFHWHITDTQSFPFEVKSQPDLTKWGAYSSRKVYSHWDITHVVEYGRVRGIRVMPEFDAPAHVGEGWQHKDMTACLKAQPWKSFCGEPPCGQLDPTVDNLYPVLEDIYREMFELFDPDVFHMGGDEVDVRCWNSSERIQQWMTSKNWAFEEEDFIRLWGYFQKKAVESVDRISKTEKTPIILWTSRLTDVPYIDNYLDNKRYVIQIWTKGSDPIVRDILERGYRVIISNYDALYLDCGGPGWVSGGNNWCSPYIGWQKVYDNNLDNITGEFKSLVLGGEAAVWSEQISETTLDARYWPRASALAERLWSNPKGGWREAEARILYHRESLVENGVDAEALQPEWCLQNEDKCPIYS